MQYKDFTNKENVLTKAEKKLEASGHPIIYEIGLSFEYTPVSSMFKKTFLVYMRRLAMTLGKSLDPNFNLPRRRSWQQKRKHARLQPHPLVPMSIKLNNTSVELVDISLGGVKIRTKTRLAYIDKPLLTLVLDKYEFNVFGAVRFMLPKNANETSIEEKRENVW